MMTFIVSVFFVRLEQKTNLDHVEKYAQINVFCNFVVLSEDSKILEFNKY